MERLSEFGVQVGGKHDGIHVVNQRNEEGKLSTWMSQEVSNRFVSRL